MNTRTVTTIPVKELPVAAGNWDSTRAPIDHVIIHTMVGTIASAASRFNTKNQAAAHYGVGLDGSLVHWVDEDNTAYHAGDYPMNQRSIGIEHEDNGDYNGNRTDALYTASAALVKDICAFYNIPVDRDHIRKHSEVSDNPTGCPDALDIDRIVREASSANQAHNHAQYIQDNQDPNQIKVFLGDYGWMERQALIGKLGDLVRAEDQIKQLESINTEQADQISQLQDDIKNIPPIVPTPVKTYKTSLGQLFNKLADSFG